MRLPTNTAAFFLAPTLFVIPLVAQQVQFEHLSLEHGLSQSSIYAITQDAKGFLWIGTQDGLNKYDGYTFTTYRNVPWDSSSLSDNYIRCLLIDRTGRLWIGTNAGGLNKFDPQTEKFTRFVHQVADTNSLSHNEVWCLYEDSQGMIWAGTRFGLNQYDETTGRWTRYYFGLNGPTWFEDNYIRSLYEDEQGILWVGQTSGITTFNRRTNVFTRKKEFSEVTTWIKSDRAGMIWRATGNVIQRYDPKQNRLQTVIHRGSDIGMFSSSGVGWFGTFAGLVEYHSHTGEVILHAHDPNRSKSLGENSVLSLWEDRSGILWVGTFNGLNKYTPTEKQFSHYRYDPKDSNGLSSSRIRAFSEDRYGIIWIATQFGLNRFDPRAKQFYHYNSAPGYRKTVNNQLFWSVVADNNAAVPTVWAGTNGGGVNKLEFPPGRSLGNPRVSFLIPETNNTNSLSGNVIECMLLDRAGMLWTGTLNEGVTFHNPHSGIFRQFLPDPGNPTSLSNGYATVIYETKDSTIWVGTFGGGLHKLDKRSNTFTQYMHDPHDTSSLSENTVQSIYEGGNGILWVGTYGGLNRFDPETETFSHYSMKDGLPNNVIYAILEDDRGNLWLSSNGGLTRFNPRTREIRNFDVNDGLQNNEFNHGSALKASTGEMYFGGIAGFNVFHPDSIRENPYAPSVVLTDFRVFNKRVETGGSEKRLLVSISSAEEIYLSYSDAVLTFQFAALEFTNPARNQYAYMMEGFDPEWTYVGTRREATYTNLDPGSYTFRVKASNNDGVWNEVGTALFVHIAPPFWMTWWFRGIVVLAFLSVGPFIYYGRVATLKRQHATQQEFSRKLIESQEAERKRIASELHDSIGQDLLIIKNRLLLTQESSDGATEIKHAVRDVIEYVSKSLGNVRAISRNLRPVQLDQLGLTTAIEAVIESVAEASHIQPVIQLENVDGLLDKDSEINLFRIVQESLNNVVKHSGAQRVDVILQRADSMLELRVQDDGRGFVQTGHDGLGLSGMAERARILGGTFAIVSKGQRGTTVVVRIPIHKESHG